MHMHAELSEVSTSTSSTTLGLAEPAALRLGPEHPGAPGPGLVQMDALDSSQHSAGPQASLSAKEPFLSPQQGQGLTGVGVGGGPTAVSPSPLSLHAGQVSAPRQLLWWLVAGASVLVAVASFRYTFAPGFLQPANIGDNRHYSPWIRLHATCAALAMLLGPWQFVGAWRRRYREVHRWMGRAYGVVVLLGGLSAFPLAVGVSTGPVSMVGFLFLASLWLLSTSLGIVQARRGFVAEHRRWMLRSFALTLSAVTLRLYIPIGLKLNGGHFDEAYRVIAWMCWVPNGLLAELYIQIAGGQ